MSFDLSPLPKILFGPGKLSQLPDLLKSLGQRPLLIHNTRNTTLIDHISSLAHPIATFHQHGEPKTTDVDAALIIARESNYDCLLALGGGSAIDLAKAAAALLANPGQVLDYMEVVGQGQKLTRPAAPWIALPTTAGTGAEVTRNAVIGYFPSAAPTSAPEPFKASLRSELLLPRLVLIDPHLHIHVSPQTTAASGLDALCQCIEAYTSTGANPITDLLAADGIRLAWNALPIAYEDGRLLDARRDMALAALYSGIALTNAGLGAVHGFAAPLGAMFPIPHGVICGLLLPHVVRANISHLAATDDVDHPTLRRYLSIAQLMNLRPSDQDTLDILPDELAKLVHRLALPTLSHFGVSPSHIPSIVAQAKRSSSMRFNPVPLSDEALANILLTAL